MRTTDRPVIGQIGALAFGTFAIGTDGFVIAGVLPGIGRDLHATLAKTGLLVTAFALAYAIGAPLLTTAAAGKDRRQLLTVAMIGLAVANLAAAVAPTYELLLGARVAAALAGALYSPIALATAVHLSPEERRGRSVSTVLAGLTVSLVIGVPLGSLLGSLGSWRWTFVFVAVLAAASTAGLRMLLPAVPSGPSSPLQVRLILLRRPAVVANLTASFLWITGAFTVYTFIVPVLRSATGWSGTAISGLLLAYGAAAFIGNYLGGHVADRWGARRSIIVALSSLVVSLSSLAFATRHGPSLGIAIGITALVAWAGAGWSLTPPQAHRLIELTPAAGPEVLSLNTSAIYCGIAAGAAVGGRVLTHLGTPQLGLVAAAFELAALLVVVAVPNQPHPEGFAESHNGTDRVATASAPVL
jgi:MFS transporter, DHA1 family, inner membrane transport protein